MTPQEYAQVPEEFPAEQLQALMIDTDSPVGKLTHLMPAVQMSETPARWVRPAVPLGYNAAVWPK
jgi:hypothetical protein